MNEANLTKCMPDPFVGLPRQHFKTIVTDLFLLTFHGQRATMAEMKGYRHE